MALFHRPLNSPSSQHAVDSLAPPRPARRFPQPCERLLGTPSCAIVRHVHATTWMHAHKRMHPLSICAHLSTHSQHFQADPEPESPPHAEEDAEDEPEPGPGPVPGPVAGDLRGGRSCASSPPRTGNEPPRAKETPEWSNSSRSEADSRSLRTLTAPLRSPWRTLAASAHPPRTGRP